MAPAVEEEIPLFLTLSWGDQAGRCRGMDSGMKVLYLISGTPLPLHPLPSCIVCRPDLWSTGTPLFPADEGGTPGRTGALGGLQPSQGSSLSCGRRREPENPAVSGYSTCGRQTGRSCVWSISIKSCSSSRRRGL